MTREGLWPFALETYARPGVEAALLELQNAHGQCVPYLLWALWLSASGRDADAATLAAGAALARGWQAVAIAPLRDIRLRLKPRLGLTRAADQRRLRERVKSLELESERMLLRMLQDASPVPLETPPSAPAEALAAAVAAWGETAPPALLDQLAALVT